MFLQELYQDEELPAALEALQTLRDDLDVAIAFINSEINKEKENK